MTLTDKTHSIRQAEPSDFDPLTALWHSGWIEAHAAHVPPELTARRTEASFRRRLERFGTDLRVAGPVGQPLGFCAIREGQLDQLFVAPEARGLGLARTLLADGEARLVAKGIRRPSLLCVIENLRARRFYEREGWIDLGVQEEVLQTEEGPFPMRLIRFEKTL